MVLIKLVSQPIESAIRVAEDDMRRSQLYCHMADCYGDDHVFDVADKFAPAWSLYLSYLNGNKFVYSQQPVSTQMLWVTVELSLFLDDDCMLAWLVTDVVLKHWSETATHVREMLSINVEVTEAVNVDAIRRRVCLYLPYLEVPDYLRHQPVYLKTWLDFNLDKEIKVVTVDGSKKLTKLYTVYNIWEINDYGTSFSVRYKIRSSDDKKPSQESHNAVRLEVIKNAVKDTIFDGNGYRIQSEICYSVDLTPASEENNFGVSHCTSWYASGSKYKESHFSFDSKGYGVKLCMEWYEYKLNANDNGGGGSSNETTKDHCVMSASDHLMLAGSHLLPAGRLHVKKTFVNNEIHGEYCSYHKDGRVYSHGAYYHGKKIGLWTEYNATSQTYSCGVYDSDGNGIGVRRELDKEGTVVKITDYGY